MCICDNVKIMSEVNENRESDIIDDLSKTERRALEYIRAEEEVYQSVLWKELDIASRTGSRVAKSLADTGLISRSKTVYHGNQTYLLEPLKSEPTISGSADDSETSLSVTGPQKNLIEIVNEQGEIPLREIIRKADVDRSTAEQAIRELEEDGRVGVSRERLYGRDTLLISNQITSG